MHKCTDEFWTTVISVDYKYLIKEKTVTYKEEYQMENIILYLHVIIIHKVQVT